MAARRQIAALLSADDAAFTLPGVAARAALTAAHARIAPMFWPPRVPLDEACRLLRQWLATAIASTDS